MVRGLALHASATDRPSAQATPLGPLTRHTSYLLCIPVPGYLQKPSDACQSPDPNTALRRRGTGWLDSPTAGDGSQPWFWGWHGAEAWWQFCLVLIYTEGMKRTVTQEEDLGKSQSEYEPGELELWSKWKSQSYSGRLCTPGDTATLVGVGQPQSLMAR